MKVKMYAQTGFNSVDIPDSIKLIEDSFMPLKTETNIGIIQNEYLAVITVGDIKHYEANKIDYVIIEDDDTPLSNTKTCYTVESFEMVAPDVCKFTLLIDAYNSIGGFGIDSGNLIVAGSANRMSVSLSEDNDKFFTLDEPFRPAEKIKITFFDLEKPRVQSREYFLETLTIPPRTVSAIIKDTESLVKDFLVSKIDKTNQNYEGVNIGEYIASLETDTPAGRVKSLILENGISPSLRPLISTQLILNKFDNNKEYIGTATRWWTHGLTYYEIQIDNKTIEGDLVKDFRQNGKDQDIIAMWHIPAYYIKSKTEKSYNPASDDDYGGISKIENKLLNRTITITPTTVYNNKARYHQSQKVKVFSLVAGTQIDKNIYEIINPSTKPKQKSYSADCIITADIRPDGSPLFFFKNLNGTPQNNTITEIINGGKWQNIPLSASGVSNSNYENARINQQANAAKFGDYMSIGLGILGIGVGVATGGAGTAVGAAISSIGTAMGAKSLVGGIKGYAEHSYNQAEQQRLLNMQGQQASVQLLIGNCNYIRDIGDNYFGCVISSYSDTDMQAYDTFLTKYGYNVGNMPISNANFFSRPAFNYIRINDITIKSANAGINLINIVKQQLQAGVRIWHKKPTPQDMFAGGNR